MALDNERLYSGCKDGFIRVWSVTDYSLLRILEDGHVVGALVVDADGTLFSGSFDGVICVWSGRDGTLLRTSTTRGPGRVMALALTPNGALLSLTEFGDIEMWQPEESTSVGVGMCRSQDLVFTRNYHLWVAHSSTSVFL